MPRTWLSIRVELIGGRAERFWPRPGRLFAASRTHSFASFATAIDDAFARWDRAHLHAFTLSDGRTIGGPYDLWDEPGELLDSRKTKLAILQAKDEFAYVFDFGDDWTHLCTMAEQRVDPIDVLGLIPDRPLPFSGWGEIPDQYGRRHEHDDGESPMPPDPKGSDLPEVLKHWAWP